MRGAGGGQGKLCTVEPVVLAHRGELCAALRTVRARRKTACPLILVNEQAVSGYALFGASLVYGVGSPGRACGGAVVIDMRHFFESVAAYAGNTTWNIDRR